MTQHPAVPLWPGSAVTAEVLTAPVRRLLPGEVFVFGSNAGGFHGAGSAGLACRGDSGPGWRTDTRFLEMIRAPAGSPARVGEWAVFGVARGHQVGRTGQSYAIETIQRPGRQYRRGTPLEVIAGQLRELVAFARSRPDLRFVITPVGEGYSGYTRAEMGQVWRRVHEQCGGLPRSFRFVRLAHDERALT
ncbi:MAG TPA: hypothetical protein VF541_06785 [Longimicrobium sp.]|jgi:hypothetical protein